MTLTLTSRATIRVKVHDLINAALVQTATNTTKPISVIYKSQPDAEELAGKSPYCFVSSGSAKRDARALNLQVAGTINLLIGVGIRVDGSNLSDDQVEDRLDLIEKKIFELLFSQTNHALSGFWQWSELEGTSFVGYERKGNNIYRVEAWVLSFLVKD